MTKPAVLLTSLPEHITRKEKAVRNGEREKARKGSLQSKTFEDLNNQEKDSLLKILSVRAGLIEDSDD